MAGFGLPNFGQLTEAFRKAQQIQQNAQKLQEELDAMEIEGSSPDGRASIWLSGNQQPGIVDKYSGLRWQWIAWLRQFLNPLQQRTAGRW